PYPANASALYGLFSADGYEILTERPQKFGVELAEDTSIALDMTADRILKANDRRIDMLNVKYFVVRKESDDFKLLSARSDRYPVRFENDLLAVFENPRALPRAFAVPDSGIEVVQQPPERLRRIREPSFDPERSVVLPETPPGITLAANSGQQIALAQN